MSEIDPRKNAWLEHKATRECLDGLGAVPPCELDFQRGWNAHASHTAAIREKAEALVAKVRESCFQECSNPSAEDLQIAEDYGLEHNDEVCACPCHKFDPQLTALKDELEKGNG